jgi:hypothetical protein
MQNHETQSCFHKDENMHKETQSELIYHANRGRIEDRGSLVRQVDLVCVCLYVFVYKCVGVYVCVCVCVYALDVLERTNWSARHIHTTTHTLTHIHTVRLKVSVSQHFIECVCVCLGCARKDQVIS